MPNAASIIAWLLLNSDNNIVFCLREEAGQAMQAVLDALKFPSLLSKFNRGIIPLALNPTLEEVIGRFNEQNGMGPQIIYGNNDTELLAFVEEAGNALIRAWGDNVAFIGFIVGDTASVLTSGDLIVARVLDGQLLFQRVSVSPPYQAPSETNELDDRARIDFENDDRDERIEHEV